MSDAIFPERSFGLRVAKIRPPAPLSRLDHIDLNKRPGAQLVYTWRGNA